MSHDEPRDGRPGGAELEWLDLYPVYQAPDEASAIHVQAFLIGAGIEARIRSVQIPGFDGAYAMAVGFWGHVLVRRRDVVRANAVLEPFLAEIAAQVEERADDAAEELERQDDEEGRA